MASSSLRRVGGAQREVRTRARVCLGVRRRGLSVLFAGLLSVGKPAKKRSSLHMGDRTRQVERIFQESTAVGASLPSSTYRNLPSSLDASQMDNQKSRYSTICLFVGIPLPASLTRGVLLGSAESSVDVSWITVGWGVSGVSHKPRTPGVPQRSEGPRLRVSLRKRTKPGKRAGHEVVAPPF